MLTWIFGGVKTNTVQILKNDKAAGYLELEKARVRWFMSIDYEDVPAQYKAKGQRTFRSITVDGVELEFSGGFTDLHTQTYQSILQGNGYGLEDARPSIETVFSIRNASPVGLKGEVHPLAYTVKI